MKRMFCRTLALLLTAAVFCMGLPLSAAAIGFSDVPEDAWYREYVYDLAGSGIIKGTSATTFSPGSQLTRGEYAAFLARTIMTEEELNQYKFQGYFTDVPQNYWGTKYINWAYEAGVISGYGDGTFGPNHPVTRQDMAVMTRSFANSIFRKMDPIRGAITFKDNGSIASYAANSVKICQQAGIISGYEDHAFRPGGYTTRAEASSVISRFLRFCPYDDFLVTRKRVQGVPVKAVEFDPTQYTAGVALGGNVTNRGEKSTSIVQRTGAKIAVNAAFFDMSTYDIYGTVIDNGKAVTVFDSFAPAKSALTMDSTGWFSIQNFVTRHTVTLNRADGGQSVLEGVTVNRKPYQPTDCARILFDRKWGTTLGFTAVDAVTMDADGYVVSVAHNADVPIPENGYVLAQRARRANEGDFFDTCQAGDSIRVDRYYDGADYQDIVLSIGAGPRIVKDGAPYGDLATYRAEGFRDPSITQSSALRVCVGIKPGGNLVILSAACTLPTLAQIMIDMGCTDVINFDGGGSVNLYVDGRWLVGPTNRLLSTMLYFK